MISRTTELANSVFEKEVIEGLHQQPKRLSSKYFYDENGDRLFQEIMKLEEYYLTRSEYEIFSLQKQNILRYIADKEETFQLIEFGAGDGFKTKVLLAYLLKENINFEYVPIDISQSILTELKESLEAKWSNIRCNPICDTYFNALKRLPKDQKKMVLFLGSNIGNFNQEETLQFLTDLNENLQIGDYFLLGVDLKKDPTIILDAYNDKKGVTKAFNLNLLRRINSELGANFKVEDFDHYPTYDPLSGEARSYLISKKKQAVFIKSAEETIHFDAAEPIFMETSKKYSINEIDALAKATNFKVEENLFDCKHYFINSIWKKI